MRDHVATNKIDDNSVKYQPYKDPQTRSKRHVHGFFTCSNSPNVEVCTSAILIGTLQTYTDPSQVKNIDGGSMEGVCFEREKLWSLALTKG